jgi:hypothetical protein
MDRGTWRRVGAVGGVLGGLGWAGFPLVWPALDPGGPETMLSPYLLAGPGLFAVALALSMGAVSLRQSRRSVETATGRWGFRLLFVGLVALALGTLADFWVLDAVGVGPADPRREAVRGVVAGGVVAFALGTLFVGRAVERRTTTTGQGVALLLAWPLAGLLGVVGTLTAVPPWTQLLALTAPVGLAWSFVGAWLWSHPR